MEFQPMSPEEVQRTVQFLLHHQAQFAADLTASQARFDASRTQFAADLSASQARFDESQARFDERQARFDERQARFDERQARFDERQARFDERQARFDERIEKLDVRLEQLVVKTDRVADAVLGLTAMVGHVVEAVSELTAAQKRHLRDDHGFRSS